MGGEEATCCVCYKCLLLDSIAMMVMRRWHLYMYFYMLICGVNHNDVYVVPVVSVYIYIYIYIYASFRLPGHQIYKLKIRLCVVQVPTTKSLL